MTHGLGSSARAWGKVVNELRGDPELRAHYQFWIYVYPTGNPFVLSAAEFRRSLAGPATPLTRNTPTRPTTRWS